MTHRNAVRIHDIGQDGDLLFLTMDFVDGRSLRTLLDEEGPLGLIRDGLAYAAGRGRVEHRHVDAFAHIVLAAANEVALMVARAEDTAAALADGESAFSEFLDRLLGDSGA